MMCECCENEPSVGVASIPGIPMSIGWGRKCLDAGVIPLWALISNTAIGPGGYDGSADWWKDIIDRTLPYFDKTREWFDAKVAKEAEDYIAAMLADEEDDVDETP